MIPPIVHIKLCLQVLQKTSVKPCVAAEEAACYLTKFPLVMFSCIVGNAGTNLKRQFLWFCCADFDNLFF